MPTRWVPPTGAASTTTATTTRLECLDLVRLESEIRILSSVSRWEGEKQRRIDRMCAYTVYGGIERTRLYLIGGLSGETEPPRDRRGSETIAIRDRRDMDDETLNRLAAEALLEEAKLGARRAEIMGPSGWVKPKETINKRFLHSTLRNAVLSNKHQSLKQDKVKIQPRKADTVKKS